VSLGAVFIKAHWYVSFIALSGATRSTYGTVLDAYDSIERGQGFGFIWFYLLTMTLPHFTESLTLTRQPQCGQKQTGDPVPAGYQLTWSSSQRTGLGTVGLGDMDELNRYL